MRPVTQAVWGFLMARGPKRGTPAEIFGRYAAAVFMGLVFWWTRTHT